ncbi:hypothetical protein GF373_08160 [bacterium]|nr:hypothetical protein [bacterium]
MEQKSSTLFTTKTELITGLIATLVIGLVVLLFQSPTILAGLVLCLVGGITVWYFHAYFPLFLFLLLPFSIELQITSTTRLTVPTEPMIVLIVLFFLFTVLVRCKIVYYSSTLNFAVGLMYLVMLSGIAISQEPFSTYKAIIRDTGYILVGYYFIPLYVNSENRLKHIIYAGLVIHTLLVLYGFASQMVMGFDIYGDVGYPFFLEHCVYAAFITISFSILLAYMLDYRTREQKPWLPVLTGFFALGIVLTFVRAAWLSIFFLLVFYLYQFRNRRAVVNLIMILLVCMLLGIATLVSTKIGSILIDRAASITDLNYTANYDRIDRWLAAWDMWKDYPIAGVGWGAYPDMYFDYQTELEAFSRDMRMGAHNLYLELMAETGVIGLAVFLFMMYMFFRESFIVLFLTKSRFRQVFIIGLQGAMITYLFHAFVNNLGPSDKIAITFWFSLGIIPALKNLAMEEQNIQTKTAATN